METKNDEIDLLECIAIIYRNWKIIVISTICFFVLSCLIVINLPKEYKVSMVMNLDNTAISPRQVVDSINEGIYDNKILKALKLDNNKFDIRINAHITSNYPLVKVKIITNEKSLDNSIAFLHELFNEIYNLNKTNINRKEKLDRTAEKEKDDKIAIKNESVIRLMIGRKNIETQVIDQDQKLKLLDEELERIDKDIRSLESQIDDLRELINVSAGDVEAQAGEKRGEKTKSNRNKSAEYESIKLQYEGKKRTISDKKKERSNQIDKINKLKKEKEVKKLEIVLIDQQLAYEKKALINEIKKSINKNSIKLVQEPQAMPLKNRSKMIVSIVSAIGLMAGICLAFILDLLKRESRRQDLFMK